MGVLQLEQLREETNQREYNLRLFLNRYAISTQLSMRVRKYVEWKLQWLTTENVDKQVFQLLPNNLNLELATEMRGPFICEHPLFQFVCDAWLPNFRRVCFEVLGAACHAPEHCIFSTSDNPMFMYFVTHGRLIYIPK